ncbi:unnamed protein product [Effrenium voratum]|uniref:Uncharacterized protein n=1 Tax=Effrenium voratum TaxID=2562239 RepID=A0AA36HZJ1_9DINO|nr:unnamed protein product [Effrenium voratum]CAJ1428279.1 unnamed protein product [Effrenium voratum]|mmetsp:Transcript_11885/g.28119  ORF Transcript_11885/g.28119 Transcript_11885/m.28119 type:complete len:641 (-) Transcript_11885:36-1958(-)
MARGAARVALLACLLHVGLAGWVFGEENTTCDEACTGAGLTCSAVGNQQVNSDFEFDHVTANNGMPSCQGYIENQDLANVQPAMIYQTGIIDPGICLTNSALSDCTSKNDILRRICCCLQVGQTDADIAAECFVPTTTTSTQTTSTQTTVTTLTSTTTETLTGTTQTATTSTTGTTITSTSTSVTGTTTTYTVTGTTVTSSSTVSSSTTATVSSTQTTTSSSRTTVSSTSFTSTSSATFTGTQTTRTTSTGTTITQTITSSSSSSSSTSTRTTTTTRSSTTESSTTESTTTETITSTWTVTQTITTTTVTQGARTLIAAIVPAGTSEIPVLTRTGFSEGDMILLGGREAVEIQNITDIDPAARRLEEYFSEDSDASDRPRILSAATAIFEVTPPVSRQYNPGEAVSNVGPASSYAGSDPITFFGGQKFKFWLPLHEELLMLESPELKIFGRVFPGVLPDQQWFGDFRVVLADDTPVVKVRVKEAASNQTRRCSSRRMESMDIVLGRQRLPLREMQRRPMEFTAGEAVRFAVNCRQQDRPLLASSRTEYLHFETPSIVFLIVAAHAGNEFPHDMRLQLKYMHLDLLILEMPRKHEFRGVLPEIWGLQPRSEAVQTMLTPPEVEPRLAPTVCQDRPGAVCMS